MEQSAGVLLIMRNPYDAFKAEFNRKQTQRGVVNGVRGRSHVGHTDPAGFPQFRKKIRAYESQLVSDRSIVLREILSRNPSVPDAPNYRISVVEK